MRCESLVDVPCAQTQCRYPSVSAGLAGIEEFEV